MMPSPYSDLIAPHYILLTHRSTALSNNNSNANTLHIMLMQSFTLALMVTAASALAPPAQQTLWFVVALGHCGKGNGVLAPIGFFE
jgi:hypothetical protein